MATDGTDGNEPEHAEPEPDGDNRGDSQAELVRELIGYEGRMIWPSKSAYLREFPENVPIFNANICLEAGKLWFGDLDLTAEEPKLLELARRLGEIIYVLYESDARFRNEASPRLGRAVYSCAPSGHYRLDPLNFERWKDGVIHTRARPKQPRYRRPGRPGLWRFWQFRTVTDAERSRGTGYPRSRLIYFGRRGARFKERNGLLALGHHHQRLLGERSESLEWTWYPAASKQWAPTRRVRIGLPTGGRRRVKLAADLEPGAMWQFYVILAAAPPGASGQDDDSLGDEP